MKDFFKWLGIFVLAAVSGFSLSNCDNGSTSEKKDNAPELIYMDITE